MEQTRKNKHLQKKRTLMYFIQAAEEIAAEKGMEKLTAREVADRAGYNVATLYNYFENLNHLILFTSIKYLNNYVLELPEWLAESKTAKDRFFNAWKCFCFHAFDRPEIFHMVFFGEFPPETVKNSIKLYYEIFPDSLEGIHEDFLDIVTSSDFKERNINSFKMITLPDTSVVPKDEKLDFYSEMASLIFQSMLYNAINKKRNGTLSVEAETECFFLYLRKLIET